MLNVLLPCLLALSSVSSRTPTAVDATPAIYAAAESASSNGPSAFRLRKLHLVRPDLIPYPLAYSVYC